MKRINRTHVLGILSLILAAWIALETSQLTSRFVTNEPGPKLFPYISAIGIAVCGVLCMLFDAKNDQGQKVTKKHLLRMLLIIVECVVIALLLKWAGFWIGAIIGMMAIIFTLKEENKVKPLMMFVICAVICSVLYFAFTRLFNIPLPSGDIWKLLNVRMP